MTRLLCQSLNALNQPLLAGALALQRSGYQFIRTVLDQQPMDDDGVLLPLSVQPRVALLVQLQVLRQAVPDQVVPAILEVQPVGAAGRLGQQDVQFAAVPGISFLTACQHGKSEAPLARFQL